MKKLASILSGVILLGLSQGSAMSADLLDGLYDRQGTDGLHRSVEISPAAGKAKTAVYRMNAVVDFQICKLTIHVVTETAIPAGYNQSDYLAGKILSCTATDNTCGTAPTCSGQLPVRIVQSSDILLCLYWQGSSEPDCFDRIRSESLMEARTVGGIFVKRGKE
jgi:hypothetical protein